MTARATWFSALLLFFAIPHSHAGTAAFDLPGPHMQVRVTRSGKTLPIAGVPNLQPGDRIWIHPDLPPSQSVRYVLVAAFLRGATNPPPENWFIRSETWNQKVSEEGIVLTVPKDAQQVLLFLAPDTNGGFSTLRSAVRGKPGAFVRAAQDLNQASLDRSRLDTYLAAIRETSDTNPEALHDRSVLLARSLNIKLDQQCFDKPTAQQAPCLMQNTDQLVLEDAHSQSMVTTLTSGASSDLIGQITTTRVAGAGAYSPYVGAIVDLARMFENFRTTEFQYIPALAVPTHDELNLKLNNPPSFQKPRSVLVIALPDVEDPQPPPLRAVNPKEVSCLQRPSLVMPVEGGPLVFSTALAHDFVLHVETKSRQSIDLPAMADPAPGGFAINTHKLNPGSLDAEAVGTLHGYWGFEPYQGPSFHLRSVRPGKWTVAAEERTGLIVGREDALHLRSEDVACVVQITMRDERGTEVVLPWKAVKPDELETRVPLKGASAGPIAIQIKQYGLSEPDSVTLQTYAEASHLDELRINAGDREAVLVGSRLDEVSGLELNGIHFAPGTLTRSEQKDQLQIAAPEGTSPAFAAGEGAVAHVTLRDGRTLNLPATIGQPRPRVTLVSKRVDPGPVASAIRLGSENEVPQEGKLSFLLKTEIPTVFARNEKIEVAAEDGSFDATLSLDDGRLILEDVQTVLVQLDPAKDFGRSAFGPLRFRPISPDGKKGDWQPLATLVRTPSLTEIHCPSAEEKQCTLTGSSLFLLDSVAGDAAFSESVSIPLGFMNSSVNVPRPSGTVLYIKLRDDPSVVSVVTLPFSSNSARSGVTQNSETHESTD
jgi:hypothetical protein